MATVNDDNAGDFTNDLATDIGPLLALFGEKMTIQYLSESASFLDYFIFAMAPVGIITGIVSAIRLCGHASIRAFIGRSQEGEGAVEAELCTSTSRDVCELFTKGGVQRVLGRPSILELVYVERHGNMPAEEVSLYLSRDYFENRLTSDKSEWKRVDGASTGQLGPKPRKTVAFAPNPNLSLNVGVRKQPPWVFWSIAVTGAVLQTGVIVLAGVGVWIRRWNLNEAEGSAKNYAPSMFITGTVMLCVGMWSCAALIGQTTDEIRFKRVDPHSARRSRLLWLQPGPQVIGDQSFDPFAYFENTKKDPLRIWTSSSKCSPDNFELYTVFAVFITLAGYVMQFIGLRGMKGWVSLAQLGITVIMSLLRGLLRIKRLGRQDNELGKMPDLVAGHELDWLASNIVSQNPQEKFFWHITGRYEDACEIDEPSKQHVASAPVSKKSTSKASDSGSQIATHEPSQRLDPQVHDLQLGNHLFQIRVRLAHLTGNVLSRKLDDSEYQVWEDQYVRVREKARQVATALCTAAGQLDKHHRNKNLIMFIGASSLVQGRQRSPEEAQTIKVTLHPPDAFSTTGWRLDSAQLEAALGLWVWTMLSDERVTKSSNDQKSRSKAERISTARIVSAGIADGNWDAKVNIQSEMDLWLGRSAMKFREGLLHCHVNTSCGLATLFELSKHASMRRGPDSKSEETISLQNDRGDSINQAKIPDFRPLDFSEEDKLSLQRFSGWCHIDGKNNTGSGPPTSLAKNSTLGSEGTAKFRIQYSDLTISKTSLLDLCAQELFTSLMMSLAGFLPLSKTVPREDTGQIRLENESVNAFVNAFQEAGLGTSSDAMLCVVPALRKKLAPLDSKRLLSALCRSANSYRQNSEWQRAETILLWACTHFAPSREQSQPEKPSQVFEEALLATAELYRWSISHSIWTPDDPRATSRRLFGTDGIRKIFHAYGHVGAECRTILDCYQNLSDTLGGPTSKYITCESPCNDLKVALYNRERVRALHALCFITPETVRSGDFSLRSALPWAIRNNWSEIADVLLEMGVDVNSKAVDANSSSKPSSAFAAFLPPGQSDDDARTALSYCAELGYEKYLAPLLHHGAAIDEPAGRLSRAPLSYAAANGHDHFVQLLLESAGFVNVDRQDNQGRSCLALAAQNGHSAVVQVLLDYTVNVDITDNGWTPLMMASSNGHTSVVQQLLDRGAQVDKVDTKWTSKLDIPSNKMDTALILAANKGHLDIVGKLLDNGADIEKKGRYDRTALSNAAESGHVSVTRMLLERGANIESKDDKGRTPLSNAAGSGHSSVARLLLDRGAYVDSRAEYNDTPLMYAITGRHHDMASLLIKGGANVNYQRPKGKQFLFGVLPSTPLRAAISSGDELMAELLIEYGADIECTFGGSERDLTPLAVAIDEEKETIAQVLIKRGANVHWISEDGVTMLKRAVRKNALTVVPLLLEKDVNIEACEPLLCAAEMGHTDIAKMLIEKGADLASRTDTHTSPLLKAAEAGHADMVRLLVSKGAPLEETAGSYKRLTALHYAVDGNHVDCVRVLVECGADLEARSFSGETPLHLAAKKRWLDCMRILVDHGASLEAKDSELRTPLYLCAFISRELMNSDNPLPQWVEPLGSRDCIVFLKDRGATVDTSNDRGRLVAARLENILNPAPDPSGDSKP